MSGGDGTREAYLLCETTVVLTVDLKTLEVVALHVEPAAFRRAHVGLNFDADETEWQQARVAAVAAANRHFGG